MIGKILEWLQEHFNVPVQPIIFGFSSLVGAVLGLYVGFWSEAVLFYPFRRISLEAVGNAGKETLPNGALGC